MGKNRRRCRLTAGWEIPGPAASGSSGDRSRAQLATVHAPRRPLAVALPRLIRSSRDFHLAEARGGGGSSVHFRVDRVDVPVLGRGQARRWTSLGLRACWWWRAGHHPGGRALPEVRAARAEAGLSSCWKDGHEWIGDMGTAAGAGAEPALPAHAGSWSDLGLAGTMTVNGRGGPGVSPAGRQLARSVPRPSQCSALSTMNSWEVWPPALSGFTRSSSEAIGWFAGAATIASSWGGHSGSSVRACGRKRVPAPGMVERYIYELNGDFYFS